jgi:hypothetical protein
MPTLRDQLYQYETFLANIGRCITGWVFIEEKLFDLCLMTLKAPKKQTAIVYYRTPTIDSRLALVEELIAAVLPTKKPGEHSSKAEIEWDAIAKEIRLLLPERNALAHFPLKEIFLPIESYEEAANPDFRQPRKLAIRPHKNERLRKEPKIQSMDAESLPKHWRRINQLSMDLYSFQSTLRAAISK